MPEAPPPATLPELRTEAFDYELPERLVAQAPARPRDSARMLVVRPEGFADARVPDLPGLLEPGDLMVVNDTRVIPARLRGRRGDAGVEIMLNRSEGGGLWHALVRNARRLRPGDRVEIEGAPGLRGPRRGAAGGRGRDPRLRPGPGGAGRGARRRRRGAPAPLHKA
jgi:S-adenosylmethionine:tRNA ribosyltransferase-isomerase